VVIELDPYGGWYQCDDRHQWRPAGDQLVPKHRAAPRARDVLYSMGAVITG
jgi:hypothetical protein